MEATFFVPCRVIDVDVLEAPRENMTRLEQFVLEAVHLGVGDFDELRDFFGLRDRVMIDLLTDLWRLGYVAMDLTSSKVTLSEASRAHACAGTLSELAIVKASERRDRVFQELLSGHVMRMQRRPDQMPPRDQLPLPLAFREPPPVQQDELVQVLEELATSRRRDYGVPDTRVIQARVAVPPDGRAAQEGWLAITTDVVRDDNAGRLHVQVTGPVTLSRRVRTHLAAAIENLAAEMPEHISFARFAEGDSVQHSQEATDLWGALSRLDHQVDLLGSPSLNVPLRSAALLDARREVVDHLREATSSQVTVSVVTSGRAVQSKVVEMLKRAMNEGARQVVFASTTVDYKTIDSLQSVLRTVIDAGVRVVILWSKPLSTDVANRLKSISEATTPRGSAGSVPRLVVASKTCAIQAGLMIVDDREVLIGHHGLLTDTGDTSIAAVHVTTHSGGSEMASSLLYWAKQHFADYAAGRLISLPDETYEVVTAAAIPSPMVAPIGGTEPWAAEAVLRVWKLAWQQQAQQLRASTMALGWNATPVFDDQQRQVLWAALRRAESPLVILSRKVHERVLSEGFLNALEARLEAGALTVIGYRTGQREMAPALKALDPLLRRYSETLRVTQVLLEAEVVCDDRGLLVTAFPLLRDNRTAREGRRVVSCASLLLQHPAGMPMYATLLREWGIDLAVNVPTPVAVSPPPDPLIIDVQALLSEVQALATDAPRAEVLRRWFGSRSATDGWAALDIMREVHVPESLLETAVGACLWTGRSETPSANGNEWLRWLISRFWNTQRFIEAYVLGGPSPAPDLHGAALSPVLLAGAALRGTREQAEWLSDSALDARGTDVDGLALLAIESLLVDGVAEAEESLRVLEPLIRHRAIQGLGTAAQRYWTDTREALPLQTLLERRALESMHGDIADCHHAAIEAIDDARNTGFRFILGFTVWQQLFSSDGPLAKLEDALRAERAGDVRIWLQQHGFTRRAMEALLDATATQVAHAEGWNDEPQIHSGKRTACLARLVRLATAARRWAALVPDTSPRAAGVSAATTVFARDLHLIESELRALATSGDVCAPLAQLVTERLTPVLELTT